MNKGDLRICFDKIKPDEYAKKRMLDTVLNSAGKRRGGHMAFAYCKKAVPALALALVIAVGLVSYSALSGNRITHPRYENVTDQSGIGREDAVAPLTDQFQLEGRHYILLSDDLRLAYGLPDEVSEHHIGEKLAKITDSPDKGLTGCDVYSYIPAGGDAVVAVKKDNEFRLFRFFVFESYNNNQDEASIKYLELYGINKAEDIAKIQFIGHSEYSKLQGIEDIRGEIIESDGIAGFYAYYSVLKNSSDKYFDRLFGYDDMADTGSIGSDINPGAPDAFSPDHIPEPDMLPPDQTGFAENLSAVIPCEGPAGAGSGEAPVSNGAQDESSLGMIDMGNSGLGSSVEPQGGSAGNALADSITIRIYSQSGLYYDSEYYPNIGFISRYEISEDFAAFIAAYLSI